jgi:hypothetical protein
VAEAVVSSGESLRAAYDAHVGLCQHYSGLVFRGRLAIVTLTVAAVSVSLGLLPGTAPGPSPIGAGMLAYASACLVALLHAAEVGYVKRFFQVVASGREIETAMGVPSYFSRYDQPEGWPLRLIYFFSVGMLVLIALIRFWPVTTDLPLRPLVLVAAAVVPFLPLVFSVQRAQELYGKYVESRSGDRRPSKGS